MKKKSRKKGEEKREGRTRCQESLRGVQGKCRLRNTLFTIGVACVDISRNDVGNSTIASLHKTIHLRVT